MKSALLIVDLQNDFIAGGALAVKEGNRVIPLVNYMLEKPFKLIVATKDWHPDDHGSFVTSHKGKNVGDHVELEGIDQILWPKHCVQGTHGSEFAKGWDTTKVNKTIHKGTKKNIDSYSTFYDNDLRKSTGLGDYLNANGIIDIYIAGLATDYCVKYSVLDALRLGFKVYVIVEACRGVNLKPHDSAEALRFMAEVGANLISIKDIQIK